MTTHAQAPDDDTAAPDEITAEEAARPLTPLEAGFAEQYIVDFDAGKAVLRAGSTGKPSASRQLGYAMLQRPVVRAAVQAAIAARSKRTGITADAVLKRFWAKATADPREIVEVRRTCCRYCHGKNFDYQRTRQELARDRAKFESAQKKTDTTPFDEQGGDGYNARKEPHPGCLECFGEGVLRVVVHDTRKLSEEALSIYAGVKATKNGDVEIKTHNQDDALTNVARHLGMFTDNIALSGPGGGPIEVLSGEELRAKMALRIAGIASRVAPPSTAAPSTAAPAVTHQNGGWNSNVNGNGNGNGRHV